MRRCSLRTPNGVVGTIEVGNTIPAQGTDGEWKLAGRDAIFTIRDDTLRLVTRFGRGDRARSGPEPIALTALRDAPRSLAAGRAAADQRGGLRPCGRPHRPGLRPGRSGHGLTNIAPPIRVLSQECADNAPSGGRGLVR